MLATLTFGDLSYWVTPGMSGVTCCLQISGQFNSDPGNLATNLVLFPRLHFFMIGITPDFQRIPCWQKPDRTRADPADVPRQEHDVPLGSTAPKMPHRLLDVQRTDGHQGDRSKSKGSASRTRARAISSSGSPKTSSPHSGTLQPRDFKIPSPSPETLPRSRKCSSGSGICSGR